MSHNTLFDNSSFNTFFHCLLGSFVMVLFKAAFGISVRQLHVQMKKKFLRSIINEFHASSIVSTISLPCACRRTRFFGFFLTIRCTWSLLSLFPLSDFLTCFFPLIKLSRVWFLLQTRSWPQSHAGYFQRLNLNLLLHYFNRIILRTIEWCIIKNFIEIYWREHVNIEENCLIIKINRTTGQKDEEALICTFSCKAIGKSSKNSYAHFHKGETVVIVPKSFICDESIPKYHSIIQYSSFKRLQTK